MAYGQRMGRSFELSIGFAGLRPIRNVVGIAYSLSNFSILTKFELSN
jgi:hypothetical protein